MKLPRSQVPGTTSGAVMVSLLIGLFLAPQASVAASEPIMISLVPARTESVVLGMGCFWGAEKRMSEVPGVVDVVSGYAGGDFANPTYKSILARERSGSGRNHAEAVKVTFDPAVTSVGQVLAGFWQNHDPTQGDRQGNDIGSNYRSAVYYTGDAQRQAAVMTRDAYQVALTAAGFGRITTEIAPLEKFYAAEEYHQDYLVKNPDGYCGLGGTGVAFPGGVQEGGLRVFAPLDPAALSPDRQLVVFEAEHCPFCALLKKQVLDGWASPVPVVTTLSPQPPHGWKLAKPLWATPTVVLFEGGAEKSRYTGYNGERERFWAWLGHSTLSKDQVRIAYQGGTEMPYSGSLLDNQATGTYVDPVTGAPLFRSGSKFRSGTGWPSFFQPVKGAITLHPDNSLGMPRTEVRSASSGIHLGHVFDDGPPPTGKRYCINSSVLRFVPDARSAAAGKSPSIPGR